MKVHGSESVNGSAPVTDDESDDDWAGEDQQYDFSTLFDAPSYSEFIKTAPNSKARSYERRVQSMMKAGMIASLNAENFPDAATFLKHGPGFAKAAGNLAAEDAKAAHVIDMLTAPDSPYIMFAMVALPMLAQLTRNHQADLERTAERVRTSRAERKQARLTGTRPPRLKVYPPITVRLFKREFKIPLRFRVKLPNLRKLASSFLAPTQHPGEIAQEVFSDPSVVKALHKMGLYPRDTSEGEHAN
jgi:hypothetical protein